MYVKIFLLLSLALSFMPVIPAQAAVNCDPKSLKDSFECVLNEIRPEAGIAEKEPIDVVLTILRTALTLTAILGIIALIIAGGMYMFSAGDETQAKKAKSAIMYVIIGLIIIGLSIVTVNLVIRAFAIGGGQGGNQGGVPGKPGGPGGGGGGF